MPDSATSACRFMWSVHRPMKIGTGNELPDTGKTWHTGKPGAPKAWKTAIQVWQNSYDSQDSTRNRPQNPSRDSCWQSLTSDGESRNWGISEPITALIGWMTMTEPSHWLRVWSVSESHESLTEGKRKGCTHDAWQPVICSALQAIRHCRICCAFIHIRKTPDIAHWLHCCIYPIRLYSI